MPFLATKSAELLDIPYGQPNEFEVRIFETHFMTHVFKPLLLRVKNENVSQIFLTQFMTHSNLYCY